MVQIYRSAGDGAAPHGLVVPSGDRLRNGYPPLLAQFLFLQTCEVEIAHGHQNGKTGSEKAENVVHAILVVTFPARPLQDAVTAVLHGHFGYLARNELARHRSGNRVPQVVRVCLDGPGDPLFSELLLYIHHVRFNFEDLCLALALLDLLFALPDIDRDGEDLLCLVLAPQQLDPERRVQSARVGNSHLLDGGGRSFLNTLDDFLDAHSLRTPRSRKPPSRITVESHAAHNIVNQITLRNIAVCSCEIAHVPSTYLPGFNPSHSLPCP